MTGPDDDFDDVEPLTPDEEQSISALLASLPAEPMPPEVLARIEAALAAETPLTGTASTVLPSSLDAARRRRNVHGPMLFRAAASVVGLAGAIALGLAIVNGGGSNSAGSSTAAGGAAASSGASAAASATRAEQNPQTDFGAVTRVTRSGLHYDAANLGPAAAHLVQGLAIPSLPSGTTAASSPASGSGSAAEPSPAGEKSAGSVTAAALADTPKLRNSCVRELTDGDGRKALAVDVGTWAGRPALVIVLPDVTAGDLDVFVVTPDCGQVNDSTDILEFEPLRP